MSHETHHEEHHHEGPQIDIKKSRSAFSASFWFVIILVGLFIASLNFISVMSGDDEGSHGSHATEATSNQTMHGETGVGVPASNPDADKHEDNHGTEAGQEAAPQTEQH